MPRFITVNRCQRVYSTISHQILIISPLDPAVTVYVLDHIPISNIIYLSVIPVYPIVFPIAMLVYVKMSHQEKTMVYEAYIGLHRQYPQVSPTFSIPSGKLTQLWKITIFNGKTHYKWPFSIAMLVYQRVTIYLLNSVSVISTVISNIIQNHILIICPYPDHIRSRIQGFK